MKRNRSIAIVISALLSCALVALLAVSIATGNAGTSDSAAESQPDPTSYTFVWFSDPQHYSSDQSEIFGDMTSWIADQRESQSIEYAFMTGDMVDDFDTKKEWKFADAAISKLDGQVPLVLVAGNHDVDQSNLDYSKFTAYFGSGRYSSLPTFGNSYNDGEGRYDLLDIGSDHWLFLALGYGIDEAGIAWANDVLAQYPDRTAILLTHSYMDSAGTLTDEGQTLFDEVVQPNSNVKLVICGHKHGVFHDSASIDSNGDGTAGRTVYQVLADYQDEAQGGLGYLIVMHWDSTTQTMEFSSYSPYLDDATLYDSTPDLENFSISLAA